MKAVQLENGHYPEGTRGSDLDAKPGDKFRVVKATDYFSAGNIIELKKDDGSSYPWFWMPDKSDFYPMYWDKLAPLNPPAPSLDSLEPGMVLKDSDGTTYKVIDVLPHSVLLSKGDDHDTADGWCTPAQLEGNLFNIVSTDTPPETIEHMGRTYRLEAD